MRYLCNGFSLAMPRDPNTKPLPYSLSEEEFINLVHHGNFKSIIGHQQLAECLTRLTGKHIPYNRKGITLNYEDEVLVVYLSGRLPENPSFIEYKGRLNFIYLRFEKQSQMEISETINKLNKITMEAI